MSTYVINYFSKPSRVFVTGCKEIASSKRTTHRDPFALLLPLLKSSEEQQNAMRHAAYAADLAGKSTILQLKDWWDKVERFDPFFRFFS